MLLMLHKIHTWSKHIKYEILYRRSLDGGSTFLSHIENLSNNTGLSTGRGIAANGNNVYVVWQDTTPGNDDILLHNICRRRNHFPRHNKQSKCRYSRLLRLTSNSPAGNVTNSTILSYLSLLYVRSPFTAGSERRMHLNQDKIDQVINYIKYSYNITKNT